VQKGLQKKEREKLQLTFVSKRERASKESQKSKCKWLKNKKALELNRKMAKTM